ncbi:bacitracin ABC transporter permease [Peribacillus asahii]|uniref:Bacitracin ABC transporter permease n=1 Tax=Peribacillus asahii TaxID=228899 RepID=A0A3Q9RIU3_9BACI|nr:undecaprenyl-diphosphatase [Peribacillus asahii]AZV42606.1 bacitracin ABC transporter permease [Peribacillus asahii]USK72001.1 undecaprenyl-diphosphatase [Peribacillus asahii]
MNYKVFQSVNPLSRRCSPIDLLMILISNKIRYVFIFVLIFMWFRNDFYKKVSCNAVISVGLTLFINTLIKLFYFKPRPFVKRRVGILIPSKKDSSFPSKHTLLVFAISTSIFLYDRVLGSIMWILSVLTGFSRIWVGHHYPSDIIGSAFIGTMISITLDKVSRFANYFARQ